MLRNTTKYSEMLLNTINYLFFGGTIFLTDKTFRTDEVVLLVFNNSLIFLLLGYSCLSYYKGISHTSQKFILYFSIFYLVYNILNWFVFNLLLNPHIQSSGNKIITLFGVVIIIPIIFMLLVKFAFNRIKTNSTS